MFLELQQAIIRSAYQQPGFGNLFVWIGSLLFCMFNMIGAEIPV